MMTRWATKGPLPSAGLRTRDEIVSKCKQQYGRDDPVANIENAQHVADAHLGRLAAGAGLTTSAAMPTQTPQSRIVRGLGRLGRFCIGEPLLQPLSFTARIRNSQGLSANRKFASGFRAQGCACRPPSAKKIEPQTEVAAADPLCRCSPRLVQKNAMSLAGWPLVGGSTRSIAHTFAHSGDRILIRPQ